MGVLSIIYLVTNKWDINPTPPTALYYRRKATHKKMEGRKRRATTWLNKEDPTRGTTLGKRECYDNILYANISDSPRGININTKDEKLDDLMHIHGEQFNRDVDTWEQYQGRGGRAYMQERHPHTSTKCGGNCQGMNTTAGRATGRGTNGIMPQGHWGHVKGNTTEEGQEGQGFYETHSIHHIHNTTSSIGMRGALDSKTMTHGGGSNTYGPTNIIGRGGHGHRPQGQLGQTEYNSRTKGQGGKGSHAATCISHTHNGNNNRPTGLGMGGSTRAAACGVNIWEIIRDHEKTDTEIDGEQQGGNTLISLGAQYSHAYGTIALPCGAVHPHGWALPSGQGQRNIPWESAQDD